MIFIFPTFASLFSSFSLLLNCSQTRSIIFLLLGFTSLIIAQDVRYPSSTREDHRTRLQSSASSSAWEAWSEWSACTRSCGGGVRERRRNCRGRLSLEGREQSPLCNGTRKVYQPCNYLPCPDGSFITRESQCSKYNNRDFSGNTFIWEPFIRDRPCELSCKARGEKFFIRHTSSATDGTDCSYTANRRNTRLPKRGQPPKHICVEGSCKVDEC